MPVLTISLVGGYRPFPESKYLYFSSFEPSECVRPNPYNDTRSHTCINANAATNPTDGCVPFVFKVKPIFSSFHLYNWKKSLAAASILGVTTINCTSVRRHFSLNACASPTDCNVIPFVAPVKIKFAPHSNGKSAGDNPPFSGSEYLWIHGFDKALKLDRSPTSFV